MSITGESGKELSESIEEVFDSSNFPSKVKTVFINSSVRLRVLHNYYPRNSFELPLDFSKPDPVDFNIEPSQKTPNTSEFEVEGFDSTWVNGLFNEVASFIDERPSFFQIIHRHSLYDVFVWLLGFPFGFWVSFKLSIPVDTFFGSFPSIVVGAAYLYVFLGSLVFLRSLFHYARWVWPAVELKRQHSQSGKASICPWGHSAWRNWYLCL